MYGKISVHNFLLTLVLFLVLAVPCSAQMDLSLGDQTELPDVLKTKVFLSVSSVTPGQSYDAALVLDIEPSWHINSASPYQDWLIAASLSFEPTVGLIAHSIKYPRGTDVTLMEEKMSVYSDHVIIPFTIDVSADAAGELIQTLSFEFQPCDDNTCRAPETITLPLSVPVGPDGVPANADIFGTASSSSEPTTDNTAGVAQENDLQRMIDEYGFWGYIMALGLAFITGLLLSFSPCTYPMIPITVSIFAGQDRSMGRGFLMSLVYVGSMAMVYGVMGLIVSMVGGVFGAWLASPAVVIGIAVIFVVFSLSMFGLYELQVPMFLRQKLGTAKSGGGFAGAIVLGIVAALVVSPCVGPFVAGILLYVATSGSPLVGFLVLFTFALGLGTLFVVIGTFSSAINSLPNSGTWMESVKKFFGFVLLLMAIYFLRTILPDYVVALLTGLLLLAFAAFGGGFDRLSEESGFFARLKKFLGLLTMILATYLIIGLLMTEGFILPPVSQLLPVSSETSAVADAHLIPWEKSLKQGMQRALDEKKPVLIDTWATWCANCKVLDKKTFGNPAVAEEAKRFVPIKVQLENAKTEATREFMQRFGLKHYSLPTTLLIDSEGKVVQIIQGVIGPDDMIAKMQKVR